MSGRRRLVLIAALVLVVALLGAAALRLFGGSGARGRPDQARPGPVLLIPGYGGSQASLSVLAERLRTAGRAATVLALPDGGTGDLLVQAETLDDAVRRALDGGAASVDIVGYSAGGVVARVWVDRHDGAVTARRIVSLGSPLHGTRLAAAGLAVGPDACPVACRQLAPGSDLLASIDDPLPDGLPWLSVWTEDDETVQPPDSAELAGAVNVPVQRVCPGARVSHGELPTDPLVTAMVLTALSTAPLAAPPDCASLRVG
jgi:triacylglycerol esterase/lipase EstA (alpha/beta hydrolase family)